MEAVIKVVVANWSKFNPRTDRKNYSWLRLENTFFTDQAISILDNIDRLVYLFFLCELSKKNCGEADLFVSYVAKQLDLTPAKVVASFEKLQKVNLLGGIATPESTGRHQMTSYETRRDETNETIKLAQAAPYGAESVRLDLEKLYKAYPRRIGKQKGLAKLKTVVKSQNDFDRVMSAIERYAQHLKSSNTEAKYIKHFSTFMTSWQDWLDPDVGTASVNAGSALSWAERRARLRDQGAA